MHSITRTVALCLAALASVSALASPVHPDILRRDLSPSAFGGACQSQCTVFASIFDGTSGCLAGGAVATTPDAQIAQATCLCSAANSKAFGDCLNCVSVNPPPGGLQGVDPTSTVNQYNQGCSTLSSLNPALAFVPVTLSAPAAASAAAATSAATATPSTAPAAKSAGNKMGRNVVAVIGALVGGAWALI